MLDDSWRDALAKLQRSEAALLWLLGPVLALSACTGPVSASGRYVGRTPDRCPYITARQVAKIIGRDIARVAATRDWYTDGGSGCFYDLVRDADVYGPEDVMFEYFPGGGRAGFERWAAGFPVSGLGIEAMWSPTRLTVLTGRGDVAVISLDTANGSLAQARQIYRQSAPHLSPEVAANWTGGPALGSDTRICKIYLANINTLHQQVIKAALRREGRSITPALARDMVIAVSPHSLDTLGRAETRVVIGCDEAAHGSVPDQ